MPGKKKDDRIILVRIKLVKERGDASLIELYGIFFYRNPHVHFLSKLPDGGEELLGIGAVFLATLENAVLRMVIDIVDDVHRPGLSKKCS